MVLGNIDTVSADDITVSNTLDVNGITNLDSTNVDGDLDVTGSFTTITTDGLTEGNNLYYTTAREQTQMLRTQLVLLTQVVTDHLHIILLQGSLPILDLPLVK